MAADFSGVDVAYDSETGKGTLTGKARGPKVVPVHITETVKVVDTGETQDFETDGTRSIVSDLDVVLETVTDDVGGSYTIAADGQSYQLNA